MSRLPQSGQDEGQWGDILNKYLLTEHDHNGKHNLQDILGTPPQDGKVLVSSQTSANGSAWKILSKHDVGLENVGNTSDADKPLSDAARLALDSKLNTSGGQLTGDLAIDGTKGFGLHIQSSFDGGENSTDSTGRIILESYQRAQHHSDSGAYAHYGEIMRIRSRYHNSKQMIAWYGPTSYSPDGMPATDDTAWFWMGAHYDANDGGAPHGHWSVEAPDSHGDLQTRLEVRIWDPVTGQFGMDKSIIKTTDADVIIGSANGNLQIANNAGAAKNMYFTNSAFGEATGRRWGFQVDATTEGGSNTGADFRINRHSDAGTFLESALFIRRSNGQVGIGGVTNPKARLDVSATGLYHTVQASQTTTGSSVYAVYSGIVGNISNRYVDLRTAADASGRFVINGDGGIEWGDGGANGRDTTLYRQAANALKTNGNLAVGGTLSATGFSPLLFVRKTADKTITNSSALQNDNHLFIPVEANGIYMVEAQLLYSATAVADLKVGFSAPSGTTFDWTTQSLDAAATSSVTSVKLSALTLASTPSYGGIGAGSKVAGFVRGILVVGAAAGTFTLQWAQNTAEASDTVLYTNSTLRLTKVG